MDFSSFSEDDFLPISAMQHLAFCPRQCALIHIEQTWEENLLTAEGRILHERTDSGYKESRPGLRIVRSVRLHSFRLGLTGIADVVEFTVNMPPFPVEYKRGKSKIEPIDEIQLCAQAICLEEMMEVDISVGALYYGQPRRRQEVEFSIRLREMTEAMSIKLHNLLSQENIPKADFLPKCKRCSLFDKCMPEVINSRISVNKYFSSFFKTEE
ncbi:MAG: CRISPR-associated protein Cas4 [Clostridia bacterium]|nr:CRISPR-associated protein Cas4 [Clostridia bacterium]